MATFMKLVIKFIEMCIKISTFENEMLPGIEKNIDEWEEIIDRIKTMFNI